MKLIILFVIFSLTQVYGQDKIPRGFGCPFTPSTCVNQCKMYICPSSGQYKCLRPIDGICSGLGGVTCTCLYGSSSSKCC